MQEIQFRLDITAQELLAYYRGAVRDVLARSLDGRTVRFPVSTLRGFVAHDGVRGVFALRFDASNKLIDLRRIGV
jgi:hypothetical protein